MGGKKVKEPSIFLLGQIRAGRPKKIKDKLISDAFDAYKNKSQAIGPVMKDFEKQILLQIIDASWKDHLAEVDALRQGIGLRSYGAKNPKLEFRRESFELFESLLNKIRVCLL